MASSVPEITVSLRPDSLFNSNLSDGSSRVTDLGRRSSSKEVASLVRMELQPAVPTASRWRAADLESEAKRRSASAGLILATKEWKDPAPAGTKEGHFRRDLDSCKSSSDRTCRTIHPYARDCRCQSRSWTGLGLRSWTGLGLRRRSPKPVSRQAQTRTGSLGPLHERLVGTHSCCT